MKRRAAFCLAGSLLIRYMCFEVRAVSVGVGLCQGLHSCLLPMKLFCWLHWAVTSSTHWVTLQLNAKRRVWEPEPLNLRLLCEDGA